MSRRFSSHQVMASPGASTVEDAAKLSNDGTASSSIDVVRLLADHAIDQISKLAPEMPTQDVCVPHNFPDFLY